MTKAVHVPIDTDLAARLERLAKERNTTPATMLETLLLRSLDDEENEAAWDRRAQDSIEEFDRTGLHLTNEEVMEWLERRAKGEDVPPPQCHV